MIVDNLSLSHLHDTMEEHQSESCDFLDDGMPEAVLASIEAMDLSNS